MMWGSFVMQMVLMLASIADRLWERSEMMREREGRGRLLKPGAGWDWGSAKNPEDQPFCEAGRERRASAPGGCVTRSRETSGCFGASG